MNLLNYELSIIRRNEFKNYQIPSNNWDIEKLYPKGFSNLPEFSNNVTTWGQYVTNTRNNK